MHAILTLILCPLSYALPSLLTPTNLTTAVSSALQAATASFPTALMPIYEENPNLLPILIYQGTATEPCTNILHGLKPTYYVYGDHGYCEDWNYQNITCLMVGRVGRTFMDLNGKTESNCGHYGGAVIEALGTYNETFGNAWTWGPWNGAPGGISSFAFVEFGSKPGPAPVEGEGGD